MMYGDFYNKLLAADQGEFTPRRLSRIFEVPEQCFVHYDNKENILFVPSFLPDYAIETSLLKGTFFITPRKIIRGYPKIFMSTDYSSMSAAAKTERELLSTLKNGEIIFEEKIDGVNIRLFENEGEFFFATRKRIDGIPRDAREKRWGEIAKRIISTKYSGALTLASEGIIPVLEIVSPEFDHLYIQSEKEDAYLIDVIRKDYQFTDRTEKEKIAEKYGLQIPRLISKINQSQDITSFNRQLRGLEHYSETLRLEGVVGKSIVYDTTGKRTSDQIFLKVKIQEVREIHKSIGVQRRIIDIVLEGLKETEKDKQKVLLAAEEEFREDGYHIDDAFKNVLLERYEERYDT